MNPGAAAEAIEIEVHLRTDGGAGMARDIRLGLTAKPKELAPKYFYDERGSQLFEQITELEEYYPTRAEREILSQRSAEIVSAAGEPGTLVELGSGSAAKTRHLLSAMRVSQPGFGKARPLGGQNDRHGFAVEHRHGALLIGRYEHKKTRSVLPLCAGVA